MDPVCTTISGTDNLQDYNIASYMMLGNKQYVQYNHGDWNLQYVHNPEGYVKYWGEEEHYPYYYIKDHLGNVCQTYIHPHPNGKYCEQRMQYYPSGLPWNTNWNPSYQPYKYSGKEFIEMHGLDEYDSEARWYYPAIMRTTSMDPMCEKYYSISPYAWCGNNPVNYVDPDGRATFYNGGDSLGTDGVDDEKIYLLKTSGKQYYNGEDVIAGAGLSKNEVKSTIKFIKENSGNIQAFKNNSIVYENCVELNLTQQNRDDMVRIVSQDNSRGGDNPKNNREYGGWINSEGNVQQAEPGSVVKPMAGSIASIILPGNVVTFHSHASGGNGKTSFFYQPPSLMDINTAGGMTHYVFGMGEKIVYIYTRSGVQAEIPLKYFKRLR